MPLTPSTPLPACDAQASWRPHGPYSLRQSLGILQRGTGDPATQVGDTGAWLCFHTPAGPVTLLATRSVGLHAEVLLRAWGPGSAHAVERGLHLLGAYDDWSAFDSPETRGRLHPVVASSRKSNPGLRFPSTGRIFDALLPAILEQKVTVLEANFAWRYLCLAVGELPPGPAPSGMRLPPTPAAVRSLRPWQWHQARVDSKRSATALRAAVAAPALERWALLELGARRENTMGAGTLSAALASLPGVGPWSIAEVLQRTHGAADYVSVGDFHLAAFVGQVLTGRRVDDAGMLELLEPFSGHRQRVVRLIGLSGHRKQAFGPRLAPMDHRRR
ncbi:3-methyladenine DNA glycosylase [Paeniglutamicibacter sp. ABSL32-1]|uniref:DNA-3-methyladenine glycosylase family protein n=1 Tax=Paeniglutamicibacter quisquiliarum TaxID=2849498 RepID=UPI001C2D3CFA|nr:3-methyladenine DNA glycosylase [Paeniglutamicibacter quisquiliarum]MBV1779875.1 3-methyladenine DNA glycosylase [Paeniglutamicibacter quisquiliarum]